MPFDLREREEGREERGERGERNITGCLPYSPDQGSNLQLFGAQDYNQLSHICTCPFTSSTYKQLDFPLSTNYCTGVASCWAWQQRHGCNLFRDGCPSRQYDQITDLSGHRSHVWAEADSVRRGMDSAVALKHLLYTFSKIKKISSVVTVPLSTKGCNSFKPEHFHLKDWLSYLLNWTSLSFFQFQNHTRQVSTCPLSWYAIFCRCRLNLHFYLSFALMIALKNRLPPAPLNCAVSHSLYLCSENGQEVPV